MKINIAKSAGFCFGVRRAVKIALETRGQGIEMLGDIVHNEEVVQSIKITGIKKVKSLTAGKNKTLLVRAHGASLKTFIQAKKLGYKIIDATCPMVRHIHKIVKNMEKEGRRIIIIGDKKHDEVRGIIGHLEQKAVIIENAKNIAQGKIRRINKAAIVAQSTQNEEKVAKITETLRKTIKNLKTFNTICLPTKTKQREIKNMALVNEAMLIIGSKTSANTKRLYEISRRLNKKTFWIQTAADINTLWFKGIKEVGLSAGASTSDKTIKKVIECLEKIP